MACKICEKECPPQCIYIVKSEDKKPDYMGKPQFYPKVFDIDISVCMSCQICVEVCPFEAIKMDKVFELSRRERFDALLLRKSDLAKSNEYYHSICPTDAAGVDAKLAEAAAKKKPSAHRHHARRAPSSKCGLASSLLAIANRKSKVENRFARVAKLADAPDLGSGGEILRGSSPLPGTSKETDVSYEGHHAPFQFDASACLASHKRFPPRKAFSFRPCSISFGSRPKR